MHRAYSSKTKRFISADPLGIDGGANVYAMANMNPLAFIDPYGLEAASLSSRWSSGLEAFKKRFSSKAPTVVNTARYSPSLEYDGRLAYVAKTKGYAAAAVLAIADFTGVTSLGEALTGRSFVSGQMLSASEHRAAYRNAFITVAAYSMAVVRGAPKSGVSWKNGWRTADGKFASQAGAGRSGAAAEQSVWNAVKQKPGWNVIEGNVGVRNASGQLRYYDGAAISPRGRVIGLEVKSGSAVRKGTQSVFDAGVNTYNPAIGVGRNAGLEVGRSLLIQVP